MDIYMTNAPVPAATLGAARTHVSTWNLASFGDVSVLKGKGIDVCTDAFTAQGLYAWSPPS